MSYYFPKRWKTVLFLMSGAFISYLIRVSMSVAVVKISDELDWSEGEKGLMLSAFFWGYSLGQLPSSYLASIFGAKWMFGLSILASSVLSLVTPVAILNYGLAAGLAVRALLGLGASATFPSAFYFYPEWLPVEQRTLMITIVGSGMYLGEIVGFSLSGFLCENRIEWIDGYNIGSWPAVFVLFGTIGCVWFPIFVLCVYSTPDEDPGISKEELHYIHRDKEGYEFEALLPTLSIDSVEQKLRLDSDSSTGVRHRHNSRSVSTEIVYDPSTIKKGSCAGKPPRPRSSIPWKGFFTHRASLTLLLNNWVFGWIGFMLLSEIPAFLTDSLGKHLSQQFSFGHKIILLHSYIFFKNRL